MQCKYNSFTKKTENKTAYVLNDGKPIFSDTLHLLNPIYIHKRSPAFTVVNRGKLVGGFFPCGPAYIGDFQKQALIIFITEAGFNLFQIDLDPISARAKLVTGELNDLLFQARLKAVA